MRLIAFIFSIILFANAFFVATSGSFVVRSDLPQVFVPENLHMFIVVVFVVLGCILFALSCRPKTKAELESEQKRARGETFQTGKCPTCKEVYDSERFDLYECPTCNEKLIEVGKYYDLHPEERG